MPYWLRGLVVVAAAWLTLGAPAAATIQGVRGIVIYALASDARGAPLADLTPADVVVKEDGRDREVLSVSPATLPLQIAVLVDDNGTGVFRYGLTMLAERLQERAELSIAVIANQVQTIVAPTTDTRAWQSGISRIGVRPATSEGGQLLEGILEAARSFRRREARRPVIIALTIGGDEQSPRLSTDVLDELWKSHAALHVVYVETPTARPSSAIKKPSDLLDSNFNLSKVLGDGPKQSGGRRRDVLSQGLVPTDVQEIAADLVRQSVIAYARPAGSPPRRLEVSLRRRGGVVVAPTRAPAGD
jgi:hypothetical protein